MPEQKPQKNKPGHGALFRNNDAHPHPKAPGYRGRMTCPCCEQELRISAWVRTAEADGSKFMSLNLDQYTPADKSQSTDAPLEDNF